MKIKYNLTDKYIKYCNEAYGISLLKKKLKKKPNTKVQSFMSHIILQLALFIIGYGMMGIVSLKVGLQSVAYFILACMILIVIFDFIEIVGFISCTKSGSKEGVLEINEDGILDKTKEGIQFGASYKNIELIVVTNDIIVFLTNYPMFTFINNRKTETNKIIDIIRAHSNTQIIVKMSK